MKVRRIVTLGLALVLCVGLLVPAASAANSLLDLLNMYPKYDIFYKGDSCAGTSMDQYNNVVKVGLHDPMISFSELGTTYYTSSYSIVGSDDTITVTNSGLNCDELSVYVVLMKDSGSSYYKQVGTHDDSYCLKDPNTGKRLYLKEGESTTISAEEVVKFYKLNVQKTDKYLFGLMLMGFNSGESIADVAKLGLYDIDDKAAKEIKAYPFVDVNYQSYCWDAVLWALEENITTGMTENTFAPKGTCTRGQVATFLWRANGCPEPETTENPFTDVYESDYYYKPILWAYENGITTGTSDTTFSPNGNCTSAHVITFLWRANGEPEAKTEGTEYYAQAVAWAAKKKLLEGTDLAFAPDNLSPRGDIVTYLYRNAK